MKSYTSRLQRAALNLAREGVPVFPVHSLDDAGVCTCGGPEVNPKCSPGKHPRTPRGFLDATTDPHKITAWWNRWPEANIGIPTGKASGLLIVDMDTYKPGAMSLEEFEEQYGTISHTATVLTGRDGRQYYLTCPDGDEIRNSAGKLGPHVDIRGEGGYTLVPPSVTTGRYEWINKAQPAPAPPRLLEALRDEPRSPGAPGRNRSRTSIPDDGEPIHDGTRDETLTRIAGRLHDGTRDAAQLEGDLQAVNEARCIPPLPAEQVRKIAASIHRRGPCRRSAPAQDPETLDVLDRIEAASLWANEWKGSRWKVPRSVLVAIIKQARRHGTLIPAGVRVTMSTRALALAAAASHPSTLKAIRRLREAGIIRKDDADRSGTEAGAFVLCAPAQKLTTNPPGGSTADPDGASGKPLRAPLTAPRLRWTAPRFDRVGDEYIRTTLRRMGKTAEQIVDVLERAGGELDMDDLAAELGSGRPRDLRRRVVSRLETAAVVDVHETSGGFTVALRPDWLDWLNEERERAGEIEAYRRDMAQFAREREAYRDHLAGKNQADVAPTRAEMKEARQSFPERRRAAIEVAMVRMFHEHPEYRERRAGQIACRLVSYLARDFPRGPEGVPKDHEVEEILDGEAA